MQIFTMGLSVSSSLPPTVLYTQSFIGKQMQNVLLLLNSMVIRTMYQFILHKEKLSK